MLPGVSDSEAARTEGHDVPLPESPSPLQPATAGHEVGDNGRRLSAVRIYRSCSGVWLAGCLAWLPGTDRSPSTPLQIYYLRRACRVGGVSFGLTVFFCWLFSFGVGAAGGGPICRAGCV